MVKRSTAPLSQRERKIQQRKRALKCYDDQIIAVQKAADEKIAKIKKRKQLAIVMIEALEQGRLD